MSGKELYLGIIFKGQLNDQKNNFVKDLQIVLRPCGTSYQPLASKR